MDPQFQELASEIADAVEKRLSGVLEERLNSHLETLDERIKTHIDQFEQRAELRMKMHFENLESTVTTVAEGYGATLEKIERDLSDLNKNIETTFRDHDLVLKNHNQRIAKLEEHR